MSCSGFNDPAMAGTAIAATKRDDEEAGRRTNTGNKEMGYEPTAAKAMVEQIADRVGVQ